VRQPAGDEARLVAGPDPAVAVLDRRIAELLAKERVPFYNFTLVDNDEKNFYDSDHLNRSGVLTFIDKHLKQVIAQHRRVD